MPKPIANKSSQVKLFLSIPGPACKDGGVMSENHLHKLTPAKKWAEELFVPLRKESPGSWEKCDEINSHVILRVQREAYLAGLEKAASSFADEDDSIDIRTYARSLAPTNLPTHVGHDTLTGKGEGGGLLML